MQSASAWINSIHSASNVSKISLSLSRWRQCWTHLSITKTKSAVNADIFVSTRRVTTDSKCTIQLYGNCYWVPVIELQLVTDYRFWLLEFEILLQLFFSEANRFCISHCIFLFLMQNSLSLLLSSMLQTVFLTREHSAHAFGCFGLKVAVFAARKRYVHWLDLVLCDELSIYAVTNVQYQKPLMSGIAAQKLKRKLII